MLFVRPSSGLQLTLFVLFFICASARISWVDFESLRVALHENLNEVIITAGAEEIQAVLDDSDWTPVDPDPNETFPACYREVEELYRTKLGNLTTLAEAVYDVGFQDSPATSCVSDFSTTPDAVPGLGHPVDLSRANVIPPILGGGGCRTVPGILPTMKAAAVSTGGLVSHITITDPDGWMVAYPAASIKKLSGIDHRLTSWYRGVYDAANVAFLLQGPLDVHPDALAVVDMLLASLAPSITASAQWVGGDVERVECVLDTVCHSDIISHLESTRVAGASHSELADQINRIAAHLPDADNTIIVVVSGGLDAFRSVSSSLVNDLPLLTLAVAPTNTAHHRQLITWADAAGALTVDVVAGTSPFGPPSASPPAILRDTLAPAIDMFQGPTRPRQSTPEASPFGGGEIASYLTLPVTYNGRLLAVVGIELTQRHIACGVDPTDINVTTWQTLISMSGAVHLHPRLAQFPHDPTDHPTPLNIQLSTAEISPELASTVEAVLPVVPHGSVPVNVALLTVLSPLDRSTTPGTIIWHRVASLPDVVLARVAVTPDHTRRVQNSTRGAGPIPVFHTILATPEAYGIPSVIVSPLYRSSPGIPTIMGQPFHFPGIPKDEFDAESNTKPFIESIQAQFDTGIAHSAKYEALPEFIAASNISSRLEPHWAAVEAIGAVSLTLSSWDGIVATIPGRLLPRVAAMRVTTQSRFFRGTYVTPPVVMYGHRGPKLSSFVVRALRQPDPNQGHCGALNVELPVGVLLDRVATLAAPYLPEDTRLALINTQGMVVVHPDLASDLDMSQHDPDTVYLHHLSVFEPVLHHALVEAGLLVCNDFIAASTLISCCQTTVNRDMFPLTDSLRVYPVNSWAGSAAVGNIFDDMYVVVITGFRGPPVPEWSPRPCQHVPATAIPPTETRSDTIIRVHAARAARPARPLSHQPRSVYVALALGTVTLSIFLWGAGVKLFGRREYLLHQKWHG